MHQFLIKEILEINCRIYLYTELIKGNNNFALTNFSRLGDIEIEKWMDIPRKISEHHELIENFVFVLKRNEDKIKINVGELLELY